MEFLKTLMLYMSLTFASSVQEAPLPEPTAVPTATPVVIAGEIIPHDEDAPAITATLPPAAGETPAPPVVTTPEPRPTITPNTAYSNIRYGNRGANVKRMQERLIELGYLDGTADGAYGTKTLKALKLFQQDTVSRFGLKSMGGIAYCSNGASLRVMEKNGFQKVEEFSEDGIRSAYYRKEYTV